MVGTAAPRIEEVSRRLTGIIHKEAQSTHPRSPQRNPEKNPHKSAKSTKELKHQKGTKRPTEITTPKLLYKP
jgi:hypothetical protein